MTDPNSNPNHPQPTGMLLIDKPLRRTSMDMCAMVRARLRRAGAPKRTKVGHAGTLDPLATGLLVILIGKATRLTDRVMVGTKAYHATIDLASRSPTDDLESTPEPVEVPVPPLRARIEEALRGFTGTVLQVPPAHSAMKVGGERAYTLARAGTDPGLLARPVTVHSIDIARYDFPTLELAIRCGKGTYIRSLARDLGPALGTGGMLIALRRTEVGPFSVEHALTPETLAPELTEADLMPIPGFLTD